MNKKNDNLLLPFPADELNADIMAQRKHLQDNIDFKNRFIKHVEDTKLLYKDNVDTGNLEINSDIFNAYINLIDSIDGTYKILIESYAKVASSSSTLEKAWKENNAEPKKKKASIPTGKTVFD